MSFVLNTVLRTVTGKSLDKVRSEKFIPAVLYGHNLKESMLLQVQTAQFEKAYRQAGENQVVELHGEGDKVYNVLIKAIQIDPVRRDIIHTDFLAIDITKPVEVELPIHFTGESPAVKIIGGSLVKNLDSVHVRCLPKDLLPFVEVSLDSLKTYEDVLSISDLKLPATMTILNDEEEMIATVVPPRIEVEVAPVVEAAAEGEAGAAPAEAGDKKAGDAAKAAAPAAEKQSKK